MNTIDVVPLDKRTPGLKSIERVLKMNLAELYAKRAARLNVLAPGHAEEAYLRFVARLVRAQASVLAEQPWTPPAARPARLAMPRTSAVTRSDLLADLYWFDALKRICRAVEPDAAPEVREIIRAIERSKPEQLADKAVSLLHERFGEVHPSEAVFIWTALSLQWAQVATFAGGPCHDEAAADPYHCRVCGASPCGSVVLGGDRGGLRYLHCSLCESRWHMVRARCSCCGAASRSITGRSTTRTRRSKSKRAASAKGISRSCIRSVMRQLNSSPTIWPRSYWISRRSAWDTCEPGSIRLRFRAARRHRNPRNLAVTANFRRYRAWPGMRWVQAGKFPAPLRPSLRSRGGNGG